MEYPRTSDEQDVVITSSGIPLSQIVFLMLFAFENSLSAEIPAANSERLLQNLSPAIGFWRDRIFIKGGGGDVKGSVGTLETR